MKKICIFTGTRAEYGLLKPLMEEIGQDQELQLQLLVSGMHLAAEFGNTYRLIEEDGFSIDEKVTTLVDEDNAVGTCKSISRGVTGYAEAFARLQPDILVLLGDRSEAFAAATAALVCQLPIAHLHGGETTQGAYDEAFRHSISKMSQLHFVSTEVYRRRVIQLGEIPASVHNVGAIGLEYLNRGNFLDRETLEKALNFRFGKKNALATFHPVTLEHGTAETQFNQLLTALDKFDALKIIFTKANADTEGRIINQLIDDYVARAPDKSIAFTSMGHLRYLSSMRLVDIVVGNSSSGILEAPSFGVPTVNIGNRQKGRIKAASIIDCEPEQTAIVSAFHKALSNQFKTMAQKVDNPYRQEGTASRIKEIIKRTDIINLKKTFYDLPS
ncbi:MAG: UDP-N-acetylglucosamine 2-epimerase (hydrolyzing) [Desulfuromonadaceae bacterium]|nr:UDP-N-acetylglucosamine 2-epimerase (hydrolyzing) [Desulfuromonadaceae bacterium]